MNEQIEHAERFDPEDGTGSLIDSEHRARYTWAARVVAGKDVLDAGCGVGYGLEILASGGAKSVTGLDADEAAVREAKDRFGDHAAEILQGDLGQLPFEDGAFDVAVCFEVIEHLTDADGAIAEFRRVLRPEGVLILSTPNPDVYLSGNEHHLHEFRPEELVAAVGKHFSHVASYRQDPWLGSTIERANGGLEAGEGALDSPEMLRTGDAGAGEPTYGIVVAAGHGDPPSIEDIIAVGNAFDLQWWSEQLTNIRSEAARAVEREAAIHARLEETSRALLDANQELSQVPLLRHRLAALEEQHAELAAAYHGVVGSASWRLTAPLRRLRRRRG